MIVNCQPRIDELSHPLETVRGARFVDCCAIVERNRRSFEIKATEEGAYAPLALGASERSHRVFWLG
jgi:hypothetical protein